MTPRGRKPIFPHPIGEEGVEGQPMNIGYTALKKAVYDMLVAVTKGRGWQWTTKKRGTEHICRGTKHILSCCLTTTELTTPFIERNI